MSVLTRQLRIYEALQLWRAQLHEINLRLKTLQIWKSGEKLSR